MAAFRRPPSKQKFVLKPTIPTVVMAYFVESLFDHVFIGEKTSPLDLPDMAFPLWVAIENDEPVYYSVEEFSEKYCKEYEYIQGLWK